MKVSHRDLPERKSMRYVYRWRSLTEIAREKEHEVCTDEGLLHRLPESRSMRYLEMKVFHRDCQR
jgi:hypothetical protein